MDSRLNKNGGTLIFTTHYPELLDEYDRNDGICIVRNRNGITAENLSYILKRNDIKKSDAYQSGFLEGTTPAYEAYMRLKKSLAASINSGGGRMELAKYKAGICEGSAEEAIIDILVDNDLLIFNREEMLEECVIRCRSAKRFEERYLRKGFEEQISVIRILDSRREEFRLSKAYEQFKRSGKKQANFVKQIFGCMM